MTAQKLVSRRSILKGLGAGALTLPFVRAGAAQAGGLPPWLPQDWQIYKGNPADFNAYLLVYFGTPYEVPGVSCGSDLSAIAYTAERLRNEGLNVQAAFFCPEGQGGNISEYVDKLPILCAQGNQQSVVGFARSSRWGQFFPKDGKLTHMPLLQLVAPGGARLHGHLFEGGICDDVYAGFIRHHQNAANPSPLIAPGCGYRG